MTVLQNHQRIDYGIDAPGVMRGMGLGGIVLAAIGFGLIAMTGGWLVVVGAVMLVPALVLIALSLSMIYYGRRGKLDLRDHMLAQLQWRGDEVVIDIGAGRGLMAIGAAKRAPRGRVIAIDIWSAKDLSGNTPEALLGNAKAEGVAGQIEVVTADAKALAMADGSVDVVVSLFCIHNIEPVADRMRACREIARVLKPGGTAVIGDFPSVAGYVEEFRKAGLVTEGARRGEPIAYSIAGYLVARKV